MLDVEAVDEFLVLGIVLDHRGNGGGVENENGGRPDGDHDPYCGVRDKRPGHEQDEEYGDPQKRYEGPGTAAITTIHGLNPLIEVRHFGLLPRAQHYPHKTAPPL